MGKASARAQDLKIPITTSEKLSKSDHTIYLLSEQTNEECVSTFGLNLFYQLPHDFNFFKQFVFYANFEHVIEYYVLKKLRKV